MEDVNKFWNRHTVRNIECRTIEEHKAFAKWRFERYPLYKELMDLYGNHNNETVLEYGCGPGNDLVGFLQESEAKKVIGIDISDKALGFAKEKLNLYNISKNKYELIKADDNVTSIPLEDDSIDYVFSQGVLHYTSDPQGILCELYRVLKKGSKAKIMVYNYNSVWLHMYTAYKKIIEQKKYDSDNIYNAFRQTTDTESCPISRCYKPEEFIEICKNAGFNDIEFKGGYLSVDIEMDDLEKNIQNALNSKELQEEHKTFLKELEISEDGYPYYNGKPAGIGGVYYLQKH